MLVIKKRGLSHLAILSLVVLLGSPACTPPGPRALIKGEKLIQQGKHADALVQLQKAVQLLPKNPQAYNYLGLAYHGNNQPAEAIKAYRQALALDHKLVAARFNLGSLYLEQNDLQSALDELTSYTLIETRSVPGLLALGTAQLRSRRADQAEKTFRGVLQIEPKNAEALNNLGLVQIQRRRYVDALASFDQVLAAHPNYAPALLNVAVLHHQAKNRSVAIQKYRQYLALQPRPANWAQVSEIAAQLDLELNPRPAAPVPPSVAQLTQQSPAPAPPRTNPPTTTQQVVARPTVTVTSAPAMTVTQVRTNPAAKTNITKPLHLAANVISNSPPPSERTSAPVVVRSAAPAPATKSPPLELTRVTDDMVIKAPQEVTAGPPAVSVHDVKEAPPVRSTQRTSVSSAEKRGFLSRMNPFTKSTKTPQPIVVALNSNSVQEIPTSTTNDVLGVDAPMPAALDAAGISRYTYLSPAPPQPGKRVEAERLFASAFKAQQAGKYSAAINDYQKAVKLDPAYFEAYQNQGPGRL